MGLAFGRGKAWRLTLPTRARRWGVGAFSEDAISSSTNIITDDSFLIFGFDLREEAFLGISRQGGGLGQCLVGNGCMSHVYENG